VGARTKEPSVGEPFRSPRGPFTRTFEMERMSERSRRPVSYDSPSRARWLRPLAFLLLAGCSPEPEAVSVVTEEECSPPELTDPSTCHLPPPALVDPTPDDPRP